MLDVIKGSVAQGQTIQVKILEKGGEYGGTAQIDGQGIYFLADFREEGHEDMPFSLLNPTQASVAVEGEAVSVQQDMLAGGAANPASDDPAEEEPFDAAPVFAEMDKDNFKEMLRP